MTQKEIETIIKQTARATIEELKAAGAIDQNGMIYKDVEKLLRDYYKHDKDNAQLERILQEIKTDSYFDIIPLFYYSGNTIEHIASLYDVDTSTIARNKKRLCFKIYTLMEGGK